MMKNHFNITEYPDRDIAQYLLDYCKGIGNAISNKRLADRFGLEERRLRQIITKLIVVDNIPIGSCSVNHSGIYFIDNEEDFKIASRELLSRIKKLSKRHKCNRYNWSNWKNEIDSEQLSFSGVIDVRTK